MTVRIGSNISSIQAQWRLGRVTSSLDTVYRRLSSGQRINKAADDAAGLAVATGLEVEGRVSRQGVRNLNDGISALNIADAALGSLSAIATRVRELAEQSANGAYSNKQRRALDAEAQAISAEFNRIVSTTSFNGIRILVGDSQALSFQAGSGDAGVLGASVGGAVWDGTLAVAADAAIASNSKVISADLNGDGNLDLIYRELLSSSTVVRIGNGDATFQAAVTLTTSTGVGLASGDFDNDGTADLIASNLLFTGKGDGTFAAGKTVAFAFNRGLSTGDFNDDGKLDLLSASGEVYQNTGGGGFSTISLAPTSTTLDAKFGDFNNDGILDVVTQSSAPGGGNSIYLGRSDGTFGPRTTFSSSTTSIAGSIAVGDFDRDGNMDVLSGFDYSSMLYFGRGDGTFRTGTGPLSSPFGFHYGIDVADLNGDGYFDVLNGSNFALNNGDGTFANERPLSIGLRYTVGDFNNDGVVDFASSNRYVSQTKQGTASIAPFSLRTRPSALAALDTLSKKLDSLSSQRSVIGASQSRIRSAMSALNARADGVEAAESRIRDADVGAESASLLRLQILQQAATSVLQRANLQPQLALALLR